MIAEYAATLAKLRGRLLAWGLGLGIYSFWMIALYQNVAQIDIEVYLEAFPEEMLAFFQGITELATPQGYLDTYYFNYMPIIVGILAVGVGASMLVRDEEEGILDLVLAHPISRHALFWGRYLSLVTGVAVALLLGWLGWILPPQSAHLGLTWIEVLQPNLPLFAVLWLYASLALTLSLMLPSSRMAGTTAGALLVANYLLTGLANIDADLERVARLTPLHYYQGGYAVLGLDWSSLVGLFGVSLLLTLVAWQLFLRREIRVGGEHGWNLPGRLRRLVTRA